MPGQPELLDLPAEVLREIVECLDPRDHSVLRQTCWSTRHYALAYAFQTITLDFRREEIVRSQFQCLEVENGISRMAVQAYTRQIHIIGRQTRLDFCPTRPAAPIRPGVLPERALSAFQGVESISGVNRSINLIVMYLAVLPNLRSAHICLTEKLKWTGPSWGLRDISAAGIQNPLLGFLDKAQGITKLELSSGCSFNSFDLEDLQRFFSKVRPLKLYSLSLCGQWPIRADFVANLLPHLSELRELRIDDTVANSPLLWPKFQAAQIKLRVLHAKGQASPELTEYLSSFSGLQELSLSNKYENYPEVIIRKHARSLRELHILHKMDGLWIYENDIAEALKQCTALRTLVVSVTAESATLHLGPVVSDDTSEYESLAFEEVRRLMSHAQAFNVKYGRRLRNISFV
ncbi:hypothetical protein BZA77DRAFT_343991 [Pyronema omphalodes]|nr:hypothetical protein BZA77DRAFT_343991 [Pyronema omphalodes]